MNEVDIRSLEDALALIVSKDGGFSYAAQFLKNEIARLKAEQKLDSPDPNPTSPTNVGQNLEEEK